MKTIVSGADFFDFDLKPVFSGKFLHTVIREADSETNKDFKKGDVMGYMFQDINGDDHIIGASHQITKALTAEDQGVGNYYKITYLGKGQTAKNQPFNKYEVEQYDDEKEFKELCAGELRKDLPL
jgi:hypothetical protein